MVLMSKVEIRSDILGKLSPQNINLIVENIAIKELKESIVPEHSFSKFRILIEFTSNAGKRYQAFFCYFVNSHSRIYFYGIDKDREDFKSVVTIVAKETEGELPTTKRKKGVFKRTIQEVKITEVKETSTNPEGLYIAIRLPEPLTQEKTANYMENLGEHFEDVKIKRAEFNGVQLDKIPKKYHWGVDAPLVTGILGDIDEYIESVVQGGAEGASEYYHEAMSLDPSAFEIPIWLTKIWGFQGTNEEVLNELRKLRAEFVQAIDETNLFELTREPDEAEKRDDRVRLDAEIQDWAARIDWLEVKDWITDSIRPRWGTLTFYHTQSEQKGVVKRPLTPETLREGIIDEKYLADGAAIRSGIDTNVTFVSEANRQYKLIHKGGGGRIESKKVSEPGIINFTQESLAHDLVLANREDFARVRSIVSNEVGGKPREIIGNKWALFCDIVLKEKPNQSRVADYVNKYEKHFRDVRIESISFKFRPIDEQIREFVSGFLAQEILCKFDWVSDEFEAIVLLDERPKGMHVILDEQGSIRLQETAERIRKGELSYVHSRDLDNYIYITQSKFRKMGEIYRQVMVQMGLIEPDSEPEVKKVEEAQAPADRGIEWVRAAFLRKLETLDIDIGIDFFVFEESVKDGRMLVKGRSYLDRSIWGALNDMVRSELGGRYDPSERGWVIEK